MNELILTLKAYIILSFQDLVRIKSNIQNKYAQLDSKERAEILSLAVHTLLEKHLEGVDELNRELIKIKILSNTLANHIYDISRHDIFESILQLDIDATKRIDLAESWLYESVKIPVPRWAIADYLIEHYHFTSDIESFRSSNIESFRSSNQVISQPTTKDSFPSYDDLEVKWRQNIRENIKYTFNYESLNRFIARHFTIFLIIVLLAISGTFIAYLLNRSQELDTHIQITGQMDYLHYHGISSLSEVYLISEYDGVSKLQTDSSQKSKLIELSVSKEIFPFGLVTQRQLFQYQPINIFEIKKYIQGSRNGLIGEAEYFNVLMRKAYQNNIDPLLLLAIIGQEQSFIPASHGEKTLIINNPFNVFHSWTEYNISLEDSTQIAINTINSRLSRASKEVQPFDWLNLTYAEDTNWSNGVRLIYIHLSELGKLDFNE
ncbi:MAG: hypothetical protein BGO41_14460 [Clostridiales bacterium 38-18]|nr:MAG: hypothetical protein BGO41_14460 [Clostridiales bacterium 38-18]